MRKPIRSVSAVILLCAVATGPVRAQVQSFHAKWEKSTWRLDARPGICALVHQIPRFGEARFEQRSGRRLFFSLQAQEPAVREQSAHIVFEAPPWKHDAAPRPLGDFAVRPGKTPMHLPQEDALRIYDELEQGMTPVIAFSDWGDGHDQIHVELSPVRFRQSLSGFLECTASLLHLDFEPLDEKAVYFASNSDRLDRAARKALEEVARTWRKRRDFRIVLGGYTDDRGPTDYNIRLSRKRTRMVARYLKSRGIPAKLIESRYFGESHPHAAARDAAARADNRRVTIWLAGR